MVRVTHVHAESVAETAGLMAGIELLSVNGREIEDFLDWEFHSADDLLHVKARLPTGVLVEYDLARVDGEPLGLELEPPTVRRCANRCEFCFIEGLPKGLRRNLYIRDDDYRLSFAYGNFATLSNLKPRDEARILEYRLSPLYVSVHATPWEARKVLLNNPRVPDIVDQLVRLSQGGIQFHCQMVVVPGLNDGAVLEQSLEDLWALGDATLTLAIVPVGLTQFNHLYTGRSMDAAAAKELLAVTERWQDRALATKGHRWVYGSDELYLLADVLLPDERFYGGFPQIENGVGAVAKLRAGVRRGIKRLARLDGLRVGVVTGRAMSVLMPDLLSVMAKATGAEFTLIPAVNSLFGPTVTTAGLLVAADIRAALAGRSDLDLALIPAETINEAGIFLDDEPLESVRAALPMPVYPSYDFVDVLRRGGNVARAVRPGVVA